MENHMNKLIVVIASLLIAGSAFAADLICTVPTAQVPRAVELCEELRVQLRIRSAEWNNDVCASQFLRIGLKEGERESTRRASNTTVSQAVNDAVDTFNANWPRETSASCGDGTVDSEVPFSEECDDGNNVSGDGCSRSCQTEP